MNKNILIKLRNKSFIAGALLLFLIIGGLNACKKVDNFYNDVRSQPFVSTIGYPTTPVYVGDTVTVEGRIYIDQGSYIKVGAIKANLISDKKNTNSDGSIEDEVRFIITKNMGLGSIPVSVFTKTTTLTLPPIIIKQFASIPLRTDTTLYVSQVAQFIPNNIGSFKAAGLPSTFNNSSVDANGNIWFDNVLGIYKISGSSAVNVIHDGSVLSDAQGPFIINRILGSVISYDGATLNFSAAVRDNADTVANYVFKLCRLNLANNTITTLNRTLVSKTNAATQGLPGAFEGAIASLHVVAMSLRTDVNNNLYFNNVYIVPSPNSEINNWYNNSVQEGNNPISAYVVNNVCQLTNSGTVSSIFNFVADNSGNTPIFKAPGYTVSWTADYKISPDGSTAYVYESDGAGDLGLLQYDLKNKLPQHNSGIFPTFKFLSYDSNPSTGAQASPLLYFGVSGNGEYNLQPLPNGTILYATNGSILGLDDINQTAYCYGGTEKSLTGVPVPDQNQSVGKAKYVLFNEGDGSDMVFCGVDKNGSVYYVTSSLGGVITSGFGNLTFYKIYSKKQ